MLVRTRTRLSRFLYGFLIVTMLIPFQTCHDAPVQEMNSPDQALGINMKTPGGPGFHRRGRWRGMGCFCSTASSQVLRARLVEEALSSDDATPGSVLRIVFPSSNPPGDGDHPGCDLDLERLVPALARAPLTSNANKTIPTSDLALLAPTPSNGINMAMAALTMTIIPDIFISAQKPHHQGHRGWRGQGLRGVDMQGSIQCGLFRHARSARPAAETVFTTRQQLSGRARRWRESAPGMRPCAAPWERLCETAPMKQAESSPTCARKRKA